MKFMKNIWCITVFALLIMFSTTAYAVEIVSPANGAVGVMPGESLTVRYPEAVNKDEKMITVNDLEENIDSVVAEGDMLTVNYKNMNCGKRYKTVIKNNSGETELVTFFNTGLSDTQNILVFEKGNMDKLWNNKASSGTTVTANEESIEIETAADSYGDYGGRIYTSEFDITASKNDIIIFEATSQEDVDFKIYYSSKGSNKGFTQEFDTIRIEGGGTKGEYRIPLSSYSDWNGEVKQLLFEQTTKCDNTLSISSFKIINVLNQNTYTGDFDLYAEYGTEFENVVTGELTSPGIITASLAAVKSIEEKEIYLIIATYKDGVMTDAKSIKEDISDGQLHSAITVSIEARSGETVKAFLRKGKNDIRVIKNCILTTIE